MINKIENNSSYGWFVINYSEGKLGCHTSSHKPLKISFNKPGASQVTMNAYSLSDLEKIVLIVLSAYISSHETLEKMIANNLSDDELSKQKELTLLIRRTLKEITEYINSYDQVVKSKYQNI